jgi:LacI family transcriptional regulator
MISKSRITIKDVAKAAGVSTQTVSRVLNNRPDVSPETRAHVKKVIKELGYAPNFIAASLSRGWTNTVGVVGFGLEYFGPANVLTGIERKANQYGFSVLLALMDDFNKDSIEQMLTRFIGQQVMGIIWAIPGFTGSMELVEKAVEDLATPIVLLNRPLLKRKVVVSLDNRKGAGLAVRHLFEQGYQKVGIITGPLDWWEAQERLVGWREVMREKGISDLDKLVFEGDWGVDSGDCGFEALYKANPDLDAIFVSNDQMSLGVIQAANRSGRRIPDDLGIVGFDNIPESKFFFPPLTTIHQATRDLGALAVTRLYECIHKKEDIEKYIQEGQNMVSPELIVRQSSLHP